MAHLLILTSVPHVPNQVELIFVGQTLLLYVHQRQALLALNVRISTRWHPNSEALL